MTSGGIARQRTKKHSQRGNPKMAAFKVPDGALDWCRPDSHALSGLNKSNHFRWESTPISQNALLLLVSGKMSPKLT